MHESDWLAQKDVHQDFMADGRGQWTTVYKQQHNSNDSNFGMYCALAVPGYRARALRDPGWDLRMTNGRPGFSQSADDAGETITEYSRLGGGHEVEPLLLRRDFYGARPSFMEVTEEFRLYHNLWWDAARSVFLVLHEDGTDEVAIEFSPDEIRVKTRLLRQYQAARQLNLLLFIDSVRYVRETGAALPGEKNWQDHEVRAARFPNTMTSPPSTRYLATRVVTPPPVERAGLWPYEEADDYFPDFSIGHDDMGAEVRYSCNPDALANYFGANPEAPHYLTPVHFRKEVLQRYYDNSERYSVDDGHLTCVGLWGLRMDNDHADRVVVFLGDLGRHLPRGERDYWRSFNVAPDADMSETGVRRAFLGEWADPQAPDFVFRRLYSNLVRDWQAKEGWTLFREGVGHDAQLLQQLRVPLNESQAEFEKAAIVLSKLLIDALNDEELQNRLPAKIKDEKSIAKLKRWLEVENYPEVERDIKTLRDVQELRSKSSAHRKSSNYEAVLSRILGERRGAAAISYMLQRTNGMLVELRDWRSANL